MSCETSQSHSRGRPIRILFVMPTMEVGGAERQLLYLLERLDRTRFEPEVVLLKRAGPWAKELDRMEVRWHLQPSRDCLDFRAILALARQIRRERYDIVWTCLYVAGLIGRAAALIAGKRKIVTVIQSVYKGMGPRQKIYECMLARFTPRIVCVSECVARFMEKEVGVNPTRLRVIYNCVDVERFGKSSRGRTEIRRTLEINQDALVALCVGRLSPEKGHSYLIEAADRVRREVSGFVLLLAGDGVSRPELERLITQKSLGPHVRLLGRREDVPDLLAASDLFVLPSLREGLPLAALEAGAAGLPAVATAVGGTPECVLHERTGLLVPPMQPEALADAMVRMFREENQRRRFGEAARELVQRRFSVSVIVREYERLFLELLAHDET